MGAEKGKEWRVGVEGQQCLQLGRSRVLEVMVMITQQGKRASC